jgi:mRNA interferase MazF
LRRGDICTVAGGPDYAGKPRPAVIIQSDAFDESDSLTICGFTTQDVGASLFRVVVLPSASNGLRGPSWLMVDKISTVSRGKVGRVVGRLDDEHIVHLDQALVIFLGLATPSQRRRR